MLAYHPYWLEASAIIRQAERLAHNRLITDEQMKIIRAAFSNPLRMLPTVERCALYLFTCIAIAATFFIAAHWIPASGEEPMPLHFLTTGAVCVLVLEVLLKYKKLYRAGADDALLHFGLALMIVGGDGILQDLSPANTSLATALVALPMLSIAAIRYADRLVAMAGFACLLVIAYLISTPFSAVGGSLLLMAVAVAVYAWHRNVRTKQAMLPWNDCITALGIVALLALYFAGNTFVLQHVLKIPSLDQASEHTALLTLSYTVTLCVPILYVVGGLLARDRTLLRVGLLVEAATLATTRYYYQFIPLEHALIILGFTLVLFSLATMHMLRSKKTGYTFTKIPLQIPEEVPVNAIVLYDRFTAQKEAVRAFEAGKGPFGGGASLGW